MGLGREKCSNWLDAYLKWWVINHVGMDNYFTTLRLLAHLGEDNIHATSVMSQKKTGLMRHYFQKSNLRKKQEVTQSKKHSQINLPKNLSSWMEDNCAVYQVLIVFHHIQLNQFIDWTKLNESVFKSTNQPVLSVLYNQNMDFLDRIDQNIAKYRIEIQMEK